MSARDAIDRLNRSRSQIRGELPDRAPLDHVERMFDPPQKDRRVCRHFPGCLCGDNCIDTESPSAGRVQIILMLATALVGAGLLYAGLRP